LSEIRDIIHKAGIGNSAKKTAVAIFEALGVAEAKVHATSIDRVHFHEVGAVDAMVDIVCAAVGAEALGVEKIICSPLNVGGGIGQLRTRHVSRTRTGNRRTAERCTRVFVGPAGRTGYANGRCDCEDAGFWLWRVPRNEN
jgi:hypothetical protein